jgi:hypothetical protein
MPQATPCHRHIGIDWFPHELRAWSGSLLIEDLNDMSAWWSVALVVPVSAGDKVATCTGLAEHGRQRETNMKNPMIDMFK